MWICSCFPATPGFVNSVNPSLKVSTGGQNIFCINFILGFCLAVFFSCVLQYLFPVDYSKPTKLELEGEELQETTAVEETAVEEIAKEPNKVEAAL